MRSSWPVSPPLSSPGPRLTLRLTILNQALGSYLVTYPYVLVRSTAADHTDWDARDWDWDPAMLTAKPRRQIDDERTDPQPISLAQKHHQADIAADVIMCTRYCDNYPRGVLLQTTTKAGQPMLEVSTVFMYHVC